MISMIKSIGQLQATDRILLDANTCLFIFGPPYFRYFNREEDRIRCNKYINSQSKWGSGKVYVCMPTLSEFVNKCRDYYWKIWKRDENPRQSDKKTFRKSAYYKEKNIADLIAQDVIEMLNAIVLGCQNR